MKKVLVLFALSLFVIGGWAVNPSKKYVRKPEDLGLMYKDISPVTSDGYIIKTWFIPAQDLDPKFEMKDPSTHTIRRYKVSNKKPQPTLIICNGDEANMSYTQLNLARIFASEAGFNVAIFDWRGFGESSGFPMNSNYLCYAEMIDDYNAVIEAVLKQPEVDRTKVAVFGWSTGAYLSMMSAAKSGSIAAFIGSGTPTNFEDVIKNLKRITGMTDKQLMVPKGFPQDQMPIYLAPDFYVPTLLIVGDKDDRTPVWMSKAILSKMPANVFKTLHVVPGAGHGAISAPENVDAYGVVNAIMAFLQEVGF